MTISFLPTLISPLQTEKINPKTYSLQQNLDGKLKSKDEINH
jgi:hypothetical protein